MCFYCMKSNCIQEVDSEVRTNRNTLLHEIKGGYYLMFMLLTKFLLTTYHEKTYENRPKRALKKLTTNLIYDIVSNGR